MKALSDPQRVIALMALNDGELCMCQIVKLLGLASSTVSAHMGILKQAGLVDARKDGRWVYYRMADENSSPLAYRCREFTKSALGRDSRINDFMKKLATIKTESTEEICAL
jgi:DNA-binding transcriptional ArsR family regulator